MIYFIVRCIVELACRGWISLPEIEGAALGLRPAGLAALADSLDRQVLDLMTVETLLWDVALSSNGHTVGRADSQSWHLTDYPKVGTAVTFSQS